MLYLAGFVNRIIAPDFYSVANTANGRYLVGYKDGDKSAHLWNGLTGDLIKELTGHDGTIESVQMARKGSRILTRATGETFALLWDAETGNAVGTGRLGDHPGAVSVSTIAASGERIATASRDSAIIKLWNGITGQHIADLTGHMGPSIDSIFFSEDGKSLFSRAKDDPVAWVWDADKGTPRFQLVGHQQPLTSMGITDDGLQAITRSDEGRDVRVWSLRSGKQLVKLQHDSPGAINTIVSSNGALWRATRSEGDKVAKLWNNTTGHFVSALKGHIGVVSGMTFTKDGLRLVTWAATDPTARLWNTENSGALGRELRHGGPVLQLLSTKNGSLIVTRASGDPMARIWDAKTGNLIAELGFRNTSALKTMLLAHDDTRLLTIAGDAGHLWDLRKLKPSGAKEPFDLVCDQALKSTKRQFSHSEMSDPILQAVGALENPCDRAGPLRPTYWKQLFAKLVDTLK